jgi:serine/threonine protein kinase
VKVIPQPPGAREAVAVLADAEIENLKKLKNSANIIQLKSAIQTKNNLYIITELCEGGTLEAQLAKARRLDEKIAVGVMEQLIAGCRDLVRCRVIHRDLKPTNIFRRGSEYKIGDFGFAISVEQCGEAKGENVGSPSYMPIEGLKLNQYSHQGDIWALGIIFFQLLTGKTPWKSRTERDLLR